LKDFSAQPRDAWLKTEYVTIREFQVAPENARLLFHPERSADLHFFVLRKTRNRAVKSAAGVLRGEQ
jgi:hypothetical protein